MTRPLTIAMVGHVGNSVLVRGGLEVLLDSMAEALAQRGHTVVRRLDDANGAPDVFQFVGAFYGLGGAFEAARGVPRLVMPLLLHSDASLAWWRPLVDRARGRIPGSLLAARRQMLVEADLVLANSEFEAREARSWGAPWVEMVPAGVDLSRFTAESPQLDAIPPEWHDRIAALAGGGPFVLSVGRFERRKNHLEVALACRRLGLPLVCVGRRSPTEHEWLDELRLKTADSIIVWEDAPTSAVHWAMCQASVHVLATRHETTGLVSLEAAACGARPVAIDQPTAREYLQPFGELAAAPTPDALASAISRALERGQVSAVERAELQRLDWTTIAVALESAYRRCIERKRPLGAR